MADKSFGVRQLNILGSGTPSIDSQGDLNLNANKVAISTDVTVGGASTFTGNATFSGDVSIGGTLTYEDVTNVDSVGLITARTGIKVLAGGINAVGIVTGTAFSGFDYQQAPFGSTVTFTVTVASSVSSPSDTVKVNSSDPKKLLAGV